MEHGNDFPATAAGTFINYLTPRAVTNSLADNARPIVWLGGRFGDFPFLVMGIGILYGAFFLQTV